MRSKSMFLMIACVCGAIAAVGASQMMQAQGNVSAPVSTVEILVATRVINPTEELKAEMMALESWPADKVPSGATHDLSKVEKKFAAQKIYAGEPIINEKLLDEAADMSAGIPAGFSVVSMKADGATSVANLVRPGDRVNVMAYFTKSDMVPETGVRTILTGVKVFAVDGRTSREERTSEAYSASTVSLLIDKKDEEAWTFASELGRIRLSLGRPSESGSQEAEESGGRAFLKWLSDYQASQEKSSPGLKLSSTTTGPKASGFRMLKLHGGQWTEYEFIDGKQTPVIKATSVTGDSDSGATSTPTEPTSDYSYLNGSDSPFFEPSSTNSGPTSREDSRPSPNNSIPSVSNY
jgi:pilus assembly protein CpaB